MTLVSMKQDPKEAAEDYGTAPDPGEMPLYPWGLSICLNDESLKKLGMSLPAVGSKFMLTAMVECKSARADKVQDGDAEIGADFQITDMQLTPEGGKDAASVLWPDKD
jgi:hypothetical protein